MFCDFSDGDAYDLTNKLLEYGVMQVTDLFSNMRGLGIIARVHSTTRVLLPVRPLKYIAHQVLCNVDQFLFPTGIFEVRQLVTGMKNWVLQVISIDMMKKMRDTHPWR